MGCTRSVTKCQWFKWKYVKVKINKVDSNSTNGFKWTVWKVTYKCERERKIWDEKKITWKAYTNKSECRQFLFDILRKRNVLTIYRNPENTKHNCAKELRKLQVSDWKEKVLFEKKNESIKAFVNAIFVDLVMCECIDVTISKFSHFRSTPKCSNSKTRLFVSAWFFHTAHKSIIQCVYVCIEYRAISISFIHSICFGLLVCQWIWANQLKISCDK